MLKKILWLVILFFCFQIGPDRVLAVEEELNLDAKAYLLMDPQTGRVLVEKNSDEKRAMASTTKIMTAILALENGNLNSIVKVSPKAASVGGSSFWLKAGDEIPLEDMLYGLLLPSGNDAAVAIAENIAETVENFVALMNYKALDIGAYNTQFKNPHGLDEPGHYTTARDLAKIAQYAWSNSKFREIVQTKEKNIQRENFTRNVYNTNRLLWSFEGANGIKTGYTGKAGRCLVAAAKQHDLQLISVVLGARDRFDSSSLLLSYGFKNYKRQLLIKKGQIQQVVPVKNGIKDKLDVICPEDVYLPLKDNDKIEYKRILSQEIEAPVSQQEKIGELHICVDDDFVYKVPLVAAENIRERTFMDMLYKILNKWISFGKSANIALYFF